MVERIVGFSARNCSLIVRPAVAILAGGVWAVARWARGRIRCLPCAGVLLSAGCSGVQSALDPAGREAERIAALFWWMAAGAAVVWLGVIGLALYCVRARPESFSRR